MGQGLGKAGQQGAEVRVLKSGSIDRGPEEGEVEGEDFPPSFSRSGLGPGKGPLIVSPPDRWTLERVASKSESTLRRVHVS